MITAMTDNTNNPNPAPTGERRLLRWVLVLQVVILGWLAKNYFDGAFNRRSHNQPTAVSTQPDTPPSLEPSAQANAPSPFTLMPRLVAFPRAPVPTRFRHPADRLREEMERMMTEANRAFVDFNTIFDRDDVWATLPASPAMNMRELDDAYELSLALPNAKPDSLDVRLNGRLLSISSHQDTRTQNASSSQHFSSSLLLPGPVAPDAHLQVTNDNGHIRIRIPKPLPDATASNKP